MGAGGGLSVARACRPERFRDPRQAGLRAGGMGLGRPGET